MLFVIFPVNKTYDNHQIEEISIFNSILDISCKQDVLTAMKDKATSAVPLKVGEIKKYKTIHKSECIALNPSPRLLLDTDCKK